MGVSAGGFEAGVAEELGDEDDVGAAAHEGGRKVCRRRGRSRRHRVRRPRRSRDDVVGAPDAQALTALVEEQGGTEQGGTVVGAGPVGALAEPAGERGVQRVDRDRPDAFALAVDPQHAFAGGAGYVVDVDGGDWADPRAGVERDKRERLVAWRGAALDGSEVAELGAFVERVRCGGRDLDASGARCEVFRARPDRRRLTSRRTGRLRSQAIAGTGCEPDRRRARRRNRGLLH